MLPFLEVLQDGKERTMGEVTNMLASRFNLTEGDLQEQLPSGVQSLFYNRVAWAKSHLKYAGLIDNPNRGRVSLSKAGRKVLDEKPETINCKFLKQFPPYLKFIGQSHGDDEEEPKPPVTTKTPLELLDESFSTLRKATAADLLAKLKTCSPPFFEKVVVHLLYSMGYGSVAEDVSVTGKSGDAGIDGICVPYPSAVTFCLLILSGIRLLVNRR
jgi:restriction system protein